MRYLLVAVLLLSATPACACSYFDRVYKDEVGNAAGMVQAVYRCGGVTEYDREWICRTDPTESGVEHYKFEQPRCAGQESEYEGLKRKASEVQK